MAKDDMDFTIQDVKKITIAKVEDIPDDLETLDIKRVRKILTPKYLKENIDSKEVAKACRKARLILFREIPQEVHERGEIFECPNCFCRSQLYDKDGYQNHYCGNCGQALSWVHYDN